MFNLPLLQRRTAVGPEVFIKPSLGDKHSLVVLLKRFKLDAHRERVAADVTGTVTIADRLAAAHKRLIEMRKNDISAMG